MHLPNGLEVNEDDLRIFRQYRKAATIEKIQEIYETNLKNIVGTIVELVGEFDAFDLIELMRLREMSLNTDPRSYSGDGLGSHIEIIAAILLARPSREPVAEPKNHDPSSIVEDLHRLASELMTHRVVKSQETATTSNNPLTRVAALFQCSRTFMRNYQFDEIRNNHDKALLDNELCKPMMAKILKYTITDVYIVKHALNNIYSNRLNKQILTAGNIARKARTEYSSTNELPKVEIDSFKDSISSFLLRPGNRAAMTVEEVAKAAKLPIETTKQIIIDHSSQFDANITPINSVQEILDGDWKFIHRPLVLNVDDKFVLTVNNLGEDSIRRIFESRLNDGNHAREFEKYNQKVRAPVTEKLSLDYLTKLIKADQQWANIKFYTIKNKGAIATLNKEYQFDHNSCNLVETDGLFIKDDIAVIVEVKGKSISDKARTGNMIRFEKDVRETIMAGDKQALRLAELIQQNAGIWLETGKWLNLENIKRIFRIVVLLDDIGPIGTQSHDLFSEKNNFAWSVSLHDLATVSKLMNRPEDFLAYLQFRSTKLLDYDIVAVDELDLLSQFLNTRIFQHSEVAQHFRNLPISEGSYGAIDLWMNREKLDPRLPTVTKPKIQLGKLSEELIRSVAVLPKRGHLSACIDLLLAALLNPDAAEKRLQTLYSLIPSEYSIIQLDNSSTLKIVFVKFGSSFSIFDIRLKEREILSQISSNSLIILLSRNNSLLYITRK